MNPLKQAVSFYKLRSAWLGDGGQPVAKDEAQERANVCLTCPKNEPRPIESAFKGIAARELRQQVELKNGMKLRVDGEKSLGICGVCDCVIKLLVWVPLKLIKETKDAETIAQLPSHCWQKTE